MLRSILGSFSEDLGIDLGTANTLIYARERGIVVNEPSVVSLNTRTNQIIAVGRKAQEMVGRTPGHIIATQPLTAGVISDFEVTEKMLKYFFEQIHKDRWGMVPRPRVVIGVPLDITEVERKAVADAVIGAGAREVFLIEESMSSAIGARLPIKEPVGNMLIDMGGGLTEISVISLGGVVTFKTLTVAGNEMDRTIVQYMRDRHNLLIGAQVAEQVKIRIGSATKLDEILPMEVRGRDLVSGLPHEQLIHDTEIRECLARPLKTLLESVNDTLERTPPELVADIYERGIVLSGGGALLKGIDRLISSSTGVPVRVTEDPLTAMVRGAGEVLEHLDDYREVLLPIASME
ncbi:rod shape-determining protein [Candidatus Uhrbacteria bacterium]|nr:rod shape-determining protein [Candidatus Uhrbacteria bacterium]